MSLQNTEIELRGLRHRFGRASRYDAEGWFQTGTLYLSADARDAADLPRTVLAFMVVALAGLALLCAVTASVGDRASWLRAVFPLAAAALLVLPLWPARDWAVDTQAAATRSRIDVASRALSLLPDPSSVVERPGGVTQFTGLSFLLRAPGGGTAFATLPPAATQELEAVPAPYSGTALADGVTYAVRDVGRVRLVALPYEQGGGPTSTLVVLVLIAVLAGTLPISLTRTVARPRAFHRHVTAWSFLAPATLHLAVFTVGPLAAAAWISLHRWSLLEAARPFVGLANYAQLLRDAPFWNAIKNTAIFTLHVPLSMAVALAIALVVHRNVRGIVLLRAVLFLPTVTSLVAVSMVWQWMLHDDYGLVNWVLSLIGVGPVRWLTNPATALPSIMLMSVWLVVGYQMVLFQAGLAAIPRDLYDAARIYGAGAWHRFVHVTLPGLRHTLFFVLVTSVIGSFQVFGAIYVMTEGGPLHATDVAVFHIYEEAWQFLRFGSATAMSWMLFAIIFVVTWLQFRTLERRTEANA